MPTPASIHSRLSRQLWLRRLRRIFLLAGGIPLSLLGPLFLGTIFWFVCWQFGFSSDWSNFFWITTLVLVPLLLALEFRTGGDFLGQVARETDAPSEAAQAQMLVAHWAGLNTSALAIMQSPRASVAGLIEVFLIGPRMLVSLYRDLHLSLLFKSVRLSRAAEIVAALFQHKAGVHPSKLAEPREDWTRLSTEIGYLATHQWIGVAANGERVWLPTDVRARLAD